MGQNTSIYNKAGGFNIYPYPYSMKQKVLQFPYKFFLHNSNTAPFVAMFWVFSLPLFAYMNGIMGSDKVKKMYREHHQHEFDHPHYHFTIRPLRPDYSSIDLGQFEGLKRWRGE